MLEEIKRVVSSNKKLLLLPKSEKEYYDCFKYMYGDCVIIIDDLFSDYNSLVGLLNEKVDELYMVNFHYLFRKILPNLNKSIIKNELFLCNVANFTNQYVLPIFNDITEFYERKLIDKIYALDESVYEMLKKNDYNIEKLELKLPFNGNISLQNKEKLSIGILSNDYDPVGNFYNMLTSTAMVRELSFVKFIPYMNASREFFNHFEINHKFVENLDEVIKDNYVNLYCNFTNTNPILVIKSMDMGIPCIVGNTSMFDDNRVLKDLLVLKSDDDVNEIAERINNIKKNYENIFKEYTKWRTKYEK